jgi:TonB family protein
MTTFLLVSLLAALQTAEGPRFASGRPPVLPPLAANGGLVGLELRIAPSGIVQDAIVIDDAPPFTEELRKVVRLWRFQPRVENGARVEGRVALIGLFRSQTLVGAETPEPRRVAPPTLYAGVVMLEADIDPKGAVTDVRVLAAEEGFSAAAAEAARQFRFRPAQRDGNPVSSRALLVFGFPQPITPPRPR